MPHELPNKSLDLGSQKTIKYQENLEYSQLVLSLPPKMKLFQY